MKVHRLGWRQEGHLACPNPQQQKSGQGRNGLISSDGRYPTFVELMLETLSASSFGRALRYNRVAGSCWCLLRTCDAYGLEYATTWSLAFGHGQGVRYYYYYLFEILELLPTTFTISGFASFLTFRELQRVRTLALPQG